MRCFEIKQQKKLSEKTKSLNNNMRCFEMNHTEKDYRFYKR